MNGPAASAVLVFCLGAAGVRYTQPTLAKTVHDIKERDDVYALPGPAQLRAATLGWSAAAVDLLWADLLVDYGTHWAEHRPFKDIPMYADSILALEPDYAPLLRNVDSMLAYRPLQGTETDVRLARNYLEQGLRVRADDANLYLKYGQFLAFMAPSFLHDDAEREAWRKDGAVAIGHAVELGADADEALAAATMLTRAGATREAIRYLEHAYAFTEHPSMAEIHEKIGRGLGALQATARRDAADAAARRIDARWQREMPFLQRGQYLLLGPLSDPLLCSGLKGGDDPACVRTWEAVVADAQSQTPGPGQETAP